nr:vasoactive intestinal polypeptide receptor 2-like [Vicugna pacos]
MRLPPNPAHCSGFVRNGIQFLARRSLKRRFRDASSLEFSVVSVSFHLVQVYSIHPECRFHLEIQEEETRCAELLRIQTENHKACSGIWDNITCWRPADVGETVTVPCPKLFSNLYSKPGNISKNCTSDGWSETFPDFVDACGYSDSEDESKPQPHHSLQGSPGWTCSAFHQREGHVPEETRGLADGLAGLTDQRKLDPGELPGEAP